jgi:hypothetical protein
VLGESVALADISALILILIAMAVVLTPNFNLKQLFQRKSDTQ